MNPIYIKLQAKMLFRLHFDTSGHSCVMNNLNKNRGTAYTVDLEKLVQYPKLYVL